MSRYCYLVIIAFVVFFATPLYATESAISALQNAIQSQAVQPPQGYLCYPWPPCKLWIDENVYMGY